MFPPLHRPGTLIFLLPFFIFEFRNIFNLPFICHPVTSIVLEEELPSSYPSPSALCLPLSSFSLLLPLFSSLPTLPLPKGPSGAIAAPLPPSHPPPHPYFFRSWSLIYVLLPFISPSASVLSEPDAIPLPPSVRPSPFHLISHLSARVRTSCFLHFL